MQSETCAANEIRSGSPGPTRSFQDLILTLQTFWAGQGCVILQPYDLEMGAGTFHPATALRALGPRPWKAAYVQPSRRPKDGRYGENPNRLQHFYQFQVILKPSPQDLQALYLASLEAIGIDPGLPRYSLRRGRLGEPDARRLGAWLGMLVRRHGGFAIHLFSAGRGNRMRAGFRRIDLWAGAAGHVCARRRQCLRLEFQRPRRQSRKLPMAMSSNRLKKSIHAIISKPRMPVSSSSILRMQKPRAALLKRGDAGERQLMVLPAYDQCIKASHIFNLLDARGVISVTERQSYILRVRDLAKACGAAWLKTEAGGGQGRADAVGAAPAPV